MIKKGLGDISMLKVGNTSVSKAYVGNTLVWSSIPPSFDNLACRYYIPSAGRTRIAYSIPLTAGTMTVDGTTMPSSAECVFTSIGTHIVEWNGVTGTTGEDTFKNIYTLREVYFPTGLTEVGEYAFQECTALTKVDLSGTSVTDIGQKAFYNCTGLQEVNIGPTENIGEYSFGYCTALTGFTFSTGLTSFGMHAFEGCGQNRFDTLDFRGTSLYQIGDYAFKNTGINTLDLRNTPLHIISNEAFSNSKISSLELPQNDNLIIAPSAFTYNDFDGFNNLCFRGQKNLTLRNNAFAYTNADVIDFDDVTIAEIGSGVFSYSFGLHVVYLGVDKMGPYMFTECPSLGEVHFDDRITEIPEGSFKQSITSYYPPTLPSGVTSIGDEAFRGSGITAITLNNGLESIGNSAFSESSLVEITIPSSVTTIGYSAFADCNYLQAVRFDCVNVPNYIGDYTFRNTPNLSVIYVPSASLLAYQEAMPEHASIIVGI